MEMELVQRQHDDKLERLQGELADAKEQVVALRRNEAVIEVYKKKVDQMGDLKAELNDAQELNQKLIADIEMLQKDVERDQELADVVSRV